MISHQGTQTIDTERLTLRPFSHADNENMLTYWVSDPKIQSLYSEPIYTTKEEVRELLNKYIGSYERPDYYRWAVIEKDSGICIGQIAMYAFVKVHLVRVRLSRYFCGHEWYQKVYCAS